MDMTAINERLRRVGTVSRAHRFSAWANNKTVCPPYKNSGFKE